MISVGGDLARVTGEGVPVVRRTGCLAPQLTPVQALDNGIEGTAPRPSGKQSNSSDSLRPQAVKRQSDVEKHAGSGSLKRRPSSFRT